MVEFINSMVQKVRTYYYKEKTKTILILVISFLVTLGVGIFFDTREHLGTILNFIRTFFIAIESIPIFLLLYIISEERKNRLSKKDDYESLRRKYTVNQRKNLAIIVSVVVIVIHVAFFRTSYNIYSLSSAVVLAIIMNMIYFTRKTKYEIELEKKGYVDVRDLEHIYKLQDKEREKQKEKEDVD